ncbi:MAG: VCBS repeat-containing protein, partial [Phycisphaerales bacterium]
MKPARVEARLSELAARIKEAYKEADPGFERFFTTDGKSAHLRPIPRRREIYGNLNVARTHLDTSIPAATLDPGTAFAYLLKPFARCDSLKLSFDVLDVDPTAGSPFASTVAYHAFGQAPGVNIEQHAVWRITWLQEITASSISPDHPPHSLGIAKIQEIRVLEMADTTAPSRQFSDCTRSVLVRDEDRFPLLAYGADHWHGRLDAVCGHDASGLEGIAVGDVNGDGLDDLYVAQGAGLPNRLFVQQGDGTAVDKASEAGVDWLDATAGVLLDDLDDDGDEDLLCAFGSRIVLCRNDGRARFTPERVHEVPSSQGPL